MNQTPLLNIKAIIGLGNPGPRYYYTRHNIGFRIIDALAQRYNLSWQSKNNAEIAQFVSPSKTVLLVKPQTFMNDSGKVIPSLLKQGIKADQILVIHDELEQPFGAIKIKQGGSARGHNGLKSIIAAMGDQFPRLRFGIARPAIKEEVPNYVLEKFNENPEEIERLITQAANFLINEILKL